MTWEPDIAARTIADLGQQVAGLRQKLDAAEQSRDAHLLLRQQTEVALVDTTAALVAARQDDCVTEHACE